MNAIADRALRVLDNALSRVGQTVTLQRMTTDNEGAQMANSVTCLAAVKLREPSDIVGVTGDAPDTEVILSPTSLATASWPGPGLPPLPRRDDKLIDVRGVVMNVEAVMPFDIGGQIVRIELRCRGANQS